MAHVRGRRKAQQQDEAKTAEQALRVVLRVRWFWLLFMLPFIALSALDVSVNWPAIAVHGLHVGATTALFLALIWLPSLVRLFVYAGGAIKTPVIEVSTGGLRSALLQVADNEVLGLLIERATRVEMESTGSRRALARDLREEIQQAYEARVPMDEARGKLDELADQYRERRLALHPGSARTIELDALVGGMLATVPSAHLQSAEVAEWLDSEHDGRRLVGLAAVIDSGDVQQFSLVLEMIDRSLSAFEQYYAIVAMQRLVQYLNVAQKQRVRDVVLRQREYNPTKHQYIAPGSTRWRLTERLLQSLGVGGGEDRSSL